MAAIAVGVGGGNQILSYSPNTDQTVKLRLIGCPCTITLDGDLATYAVVNESLMPSVTVTLNYPELGPGEHSVIFSAIEQGPGGVMGGVGRISTYIKVISPYPDTYLEVDRILDVSKSNQPGEKTSFSLKAINYGSKTIDKVSGVVTISQIDGSESKFIGISHVDTISSFSAGDEHTLQSSWLVPKDAVAGSYVASANITWENKSEVRERSFRIGTPTLYIEDIDKVTIPHGEISEVIVNLRSKWNDPIDYSPSLKVFDNNKELASITSPAGRLNAWKKTPISFFVNAKNIVANNYTGKVQVNYMDTFVEGEFELEVIEPAEPTLQQEVKEKASSNSQLVWITLIIAITVIVSLFILRKKQGNKEDPYGDF